MNTIKKSIYTLTNNNKQYIELRVWFVVSKEFGKVEYSNMFRTLEEASEYAENQANEIARMWGAKLVQGKTSHIPFNVIKRYTLDYSETKDYEHIIDPQHLGLEYTCIARTLTLEATEVHNYDKIFARI